VINGQSAYEINAGPPLFVLSPETVFQQASYKHNGSLLPNNPNSNCSLQNTIARTRYSTTAHAAAKMLHKTSAFSTCE